MRQRLQVSEHERDIWPDVAVTEESLTRCISDVRIALQYIERSIVRTVPKLGYMLDTTVTTAVEEQANRQQRAECASSIPGTPAAASDSGRRQATVVFVDIHDAVEALSDSDPEAALTSLIAAETKRLVDGQVDSRQLRRQFWRPASTGLNRRSSDFSKSHPSSGRRFPSRCWPRLRPA